MPDTVISLNHIHFQLPLSHIVFNDLSLQLGRLRYGLVGINGCGKTTLLNLLLGNLSPDSGTIHRYAETNSLPQHLSSTESKSSISELLGVEPYLIAQQRINHGEHDEDDLELMQDHWDITQRVEDALIQYSLWPIDLNTAVNQLSGGQVSKLLLAKLLIFNRTFLVLDEPSNNLDSTSRQTLYQQLQQHQHGMLIASHDRTLLNHMDAIIELTQKGLTVYGGNYDFYREQKQEKQQAILNTLKNRTEQLHSAKQSIQTRMERHQQNESRGKKRKKDQIKAVGSYDKIWLKSKNGQSENTNRRIRLQANRKLVQVEQQLEQAQQELEVHESIHASMPKIDLATQKKMISIHNLSFAYPKQRLIFDNLNLELIGNQRLALQGDNGSGKSTLIKLILGQLTPSTGTVTLGTQKIAYLDQKSMQLDEELSLVENYQLQHPLADKFQAYSALAQFKFRNKDAEKKAKVLSGGERMRAVLAINLLAPQAPELVILDEPTNHLDLECLEVLEQCLREYQSALLVASHDKGFLDACNIANIFEIY